jgi:signal transduction histidine kinase
MAKVLVVDDTPDVVRLVARFLERAGHQVATAVDGPQGLRMARANPPDAILLDVMMPGMDGIEVLRHLKEDPELGGIPVILVTAKSSNQDVVAGLEAGAHDYVAKPFTREVLLARVEAAVRVKQSHDRLAEANRRLQEEIVQRVRAQRELAEARRLQAIGHLAAGIAHELNTPAQYLADNIRFLKQALSTLEELLDRFHRLLRTAKRDGVSDALLAEVEKAMEDADLVFLSTEVSQAIGQALEGVEQVASIVRSMKEFAQPGARHKQPVDLNQILLDTLTIARNEWRDVADLVTDFAEDLPMVPCLPSDLRQALVNLLVNAAEAIAEAVKDGARGKGTLTVRTRRDGDWAEIRVEDTGVGIPPSIQDQVFDPFFTTKAPGKGFGQGLSIARSIIVERHGGTMAFETEVGRGTAFVVRLPIAETAQSALVEDRELAAAPG